MPSSCHLPAAQAGKPQGWEDPTEHHDNLAEHPTPQVTCDIGKTRKIWPVQLAMHLLQYRSSLTTNFRPGADR